MTLFQPSHAMRIGCEHLHHHELCLKWTAEEMGGRQIQEGVNEHEMSQKRSLDILLLQYYYSQFVYVIVACFLGKGGPPPVLLMDCVWCWISLLLPELLIKRC